MLSIFGPLMNYFVSLETHIWVEREKKVSCFRKKKLFQETTRVEWIEANCALRSGLKIIIFRYFAFFLELTFYFLLFNHYYLLFLFIFVHDFFSVLCVQLATPLWINDFSKIQLRVCHQCCVLIGWATNRLYVIAH